MKFTFTILWYIFKRIFPPPAFLPSCAWPFRSMSCSHIVCHVIKFYFSVYIAVPFMYGHFQVGFRGSHLKMEEYKVDISEINPAYVN